MKRIFLLFFLKSFLIFQLSFSKKSEALDDQWTEIESREESLSRFNWVVRKEDQRNAYIYYMEIVDIEKSLEAIKATFNNKSLEVAGIFKSFIEKLNEIIKDINKDLKNFDDLERESQKIIDKIFSFEEKKSFLDDKDSKKRIAILQQKGNDLKLRVKNIVKNLGLIESSKINLVNSINQLDKVLKKIKDYENSSWNSYLKFDELISDSVAKNLIDSIKNNLENAKQKNNFVRGDFLNFFNSVIKNIVYAMNYIEKDFNSFNEDRVSIFSEIKSIEDLIKTREAEKEKLEEEELRIQEIERVKKENEMKLKALAQRPWYIKTKDYLSFLFKKISEAFFEGYKLASNTFSSFAGKNKNNSKDLNKKIENKNQPLSDQLEIESNKISKNKENLVSSKENEEVKEEIKISENIDEIKSKSISEVTEKKDDNISEKNLAENNLSKNEEKVDEEVKPENKIEPEKIESEAETEEKKNSETSSSSDEGSSQESNNEQAETETPDLAENKLPTTEAIKDDESSDEDKDNLSSDSDSENSQNNFVQDIPSQEGTDNNNSDDNNSENKDNQDNDNSNQEDNSSPQQDFDPSTEAAAKNFSSYSRGGQNNNDQDDDDDDYDNDDYNDNNGSPFAGAIKEYAEEKLIKNEEKKKEKNVEEKDKSGNDEKKNDNGQIDQADENDTKDKISTKKIVKAELEKKEILNIEQKGKKSKKEEKKIPFRKKRR